MGGRVPGPVCSTRVGDGWIDHGTLCRNRSSPPGVTGIVGVLAAAVSPAKARFDREHVYSKAREAARKRDIDLQIIGDDYTRSGEINLGNERYLKELIRLGSGGRRTVGAARKIQFFIVRGGGEGLLPADMAGENAGDIVFPGTTTGGKKSPTFRFDNNDLLAVFDAKAKLIGAALLQRPTSITGVWSAKSAKAVYDSWENKEVSIYRNKSFDVPYLGLVLDDGMKGTGWVDIHKQEATNGCIFIVDPSTPEYGTDELLDFEPKLLKDILASIGKRPDQVKGMIRLGVMRVIDIR